MEIQQNVLYVMTQGAYVHRDHLTLQVKVDDEVKLGVPLHNLQALTLFGNVMVSPGALNLRMTSEPLRPSLLIFAKPEVSSRTCCTESPSMKSISPRSNSLTRAAAAILV